ncbi:hypothetical protein [Kitasatospora sp. NBC_01539]|uniref:hypothetical protein n=1 Tax=Kitasatospora sp. NBC_01539 TaxID=2903577 RepID=UPI0038601D5F
MSDFTTARRIADAVLFEGYVLYPYRASAAKNRLRWQFGVLVPPAYGEDEGEHAFQRTEMLMEPRQGSVLSGELRFLRAQRRTVKQADPQGGFVEVDSLELPDRVLVPWDEGVEDAVTFSVPIDRLLAEGLTVPFHRPARDEQEAVSAGEGPPVGRLSRRCERLDGLVRVTAEELPGPYRVLRLIAVVENITEWTPPADADRESALRHSLVSTHLLLGLDGGGFLSMTDPPQWAAPEIARCRNQHTWPVLAGEPGRPDVVLSSPIILEDHPQIAPESPGALYDATEIDEILALRTATLTDQEKREARGTDERAGAVIDLADSMPPEVMERLHGAVRALRDITDPAPAAADPFAAPDTPWWDPGRDAEVDPGTDRVVVDGRSVGAGSRVRLKPGLRRTDAQDIFLHGREALVEAVLHDVDGSVHVAVTVDGDPGADLWRAQGRYRYFQTDEITPLEES